MEVIVEPHELLIDNLGRNVFLQLEVRHLRELDFLSSANPRSVKLVVDLFGRIRKLICPDLKAISQLLDDTVEVGSRSKVLEILLLMSRHVFKKQRELHQLNLHLVESLQLQFL